jgi:hypothetical protein
MQMYSSILIINHDIKMKVFDKITSNVTSVTMQLTYKSMKYIAALCDFFLLFNTYSVSAL